MANDQSEQRRPHIFHDQHGRAWGASIELKSGHPAGKIELLLPLPKRGTPMIEAPTEFETTLVVTPPVEPPTKYMRFPKSRPYHLEIDYEAWQREMRAANADYRRQLLEEGMRQHGEAFDETAPPSRSVLAVIGTAPVAVDVVIACKQGNHWILGLTKKRDDRLAKFFIRQKAETEPDYSEPDYSSEPKA